jgi:uncharacterized protein YbcI
VAEVTPTLTTQQDAEQRPHVAAISREIVQIHAEFYGRGPTKAKTIWRDEIIVCVLEEIFTKAERLMVDHGRFEDVRRHRIAFQDEVRPLFVASVERITARQVKSFLSQVSPDGTAAEVFVLAHGNAADPTHPG